MQMQVQVQVQVQVQEHFQTKAEVQVQARVRQEVILLGLRDRGGARTCRPSIARYWILTMRGVVL